MSQMEIDDQLPLKQEPTYLKDDTITNDIPYTITTPNLYVPLVNFPTFTKLQSNPNIPITSLKAAYDKYKSDHFNNKIESYYTQHKDTECFKDKFNLQTFLLNKPFKDEQIKKLHNHFIRLISHTNNFANINLSITSADKAKLELNPTIIIKQHTFTKDNNNNESDKQQQRQQQHASSSLSALNDDTIDIYKEPFYAFDLNNNVLTLNEIPNTITTHQLYTAITSKLEPSSYLSLHISTTSSKHRNFARHSYIYFPSHNSLTTAISQLTEHNVTATFKLFPYISPPYIYQYIKLTPKLFKTRFNKDMHNVKDIISLYDEYYNNTDPNDSSTLNKVIQITSNYPEHKQLDVLLLYLRYVYGFCYYCARGEDSARELAIKCDCVHLRNAEVIEEDICNSVGLGINKEEIDYDNMLDVRIQKFKEIKQWEIAVMKRDVVKEIEEYKNDFLSYHVITIEEGGKYQCGMCRKMFIGKEYVITHINNKHKEMMNEKINNVYANENQKTLYNEYTKMNCNDDSGEIISTIEEYNKLVQNKTTKRNCCNNNNNSCANASSSTTTTTKPRYVDYDAITNRKKHEIRILTYDEL